MRLTKEGIFIVIGIVLILVLSIGRSITSDKDTRVVASIKLAYPQKVVEVELPSNYKARVSLDRLPNGGYKLTYLSTSDEEISVHYPIVTSTTSGEVVEIELPNNYKRIERTDPLPNGGYAVTYVSTRDEPITVPYPNVGNSVRWVRPDHNSKTP